MSTDYLSDIIQRKRREVRRRERFADVWSTAFEAKIDAAGQSPHVSIECLRRPTQAVPRVIAEIKFSSPSKGVIRKRRPGAVRDIASQYTSAGASAVSVLADAGGFNGCPLDVRRAALTTHLPILFKEFVLDESQLRLAKVLGAAYVLLLVNVLDDSTLRGLVKACEPLGLVPVVEAATAAELERAQASGAVCIGVNARDLHTFKVDTDAANRLVDRLSADYIAIFMSGVLNRADFLNIANSRADAVLIGESLMRSERPGEKLREILG